MTPTLEQIAAQTAEQVMKAQHPDACMHIILAALQAATKQPEGADWAEAAAKEISAHHWKTGTMTVPEYADIIHKHAPKGILLTSGVTDMPSDAYLPSPEDQEAKQKFVDDQFREHVPLVANREDSEAKRAYEQWYLELIEEIYRDFPDGMNERPDPRVLVKMWREWYSGTESRAAWTHKVLCYESDVKQLRAQLSAVINLLVSYAPASHEGTAKLVLESQALIDRTPTAAMRPAQPERGQGQEKENHE